MKRLIEAPPLCLQCNQEEAKHEDLLNGLIFCSPECQSVYHRYDAEAVANSEWGVKRRDFYVKHLIGSTDIVTKYKLLCQLCDVYDVTRLIVTRFMMSPHIMKVYLHPVIASLSQRIQDTCYYIIGGKGLIIRIGHGDMLKQVFHDITCPVSLFNDALSEHIIVTHGQDWHPETSFRYGTERVKFRLDSDKNGPFYGTLPEIKTIVRYSPDYNRHLYNQNTPESIYLISVDFDTIEQVTDVVDPYDGVYGDQCYMLLDMMGRLWIIGYQFIKCHRQRNYNPTLFTRVETKMPCIAVSCRKDAFMYITIDGSLWMTTAPIPDAYSEYVLEDISGFKKVPRLPPVYKISSSGSHTMVIDERGRLWAYGDNSRGQLGLGCKDEKVNRFTLVPDMTDVVSVYCSAFFTLVVRSDDSRWTAGYTYEQLYGIGSNICRFTRLDLLLPDLTPIETESSIKRQCC